MARSPVQLEAGRLHLADSLPSALRHRIQSITAAVQPNLTVLDLPSVAGANPAVFSFTQMWIAELASRFDPSTPRPRGFHRQFDALVTSDPRDVDASYALHQKRVPVLFFSKSSGSPPVFCDVSGHPLLTVVPAIDGEENEEAWEQAVTDFLTFPVRRGKVFVIEGGDGAGKQTQVARLVARLQAEGYPVQTYDYPHDAAKYGLLIREVLGGQRGSLRAVSPLVFASLYGVNREDHQPTLDYWLLRGTNVILDRYMSANFGHQASKYDTDAERQAAIESLATFEQKWLDLPAPDRVLYLNLPPVFALRAMQTDGTRKALDEHEKAGIDYKNRVRRAFLWCCANLPGWSEIRCVDGEEDGAEEDHDGQARLSREAVHEAVWNALAGDLVNGSDAASSAPSHT